MFSRHVALLARRSTRSSTGFTPTSSLMLSNFFTTTTTTTMPERSANGDYNHVTLEEAIEMPRHTSEFNAELLVKAALHGNPSAIRERLVREVMRVDNISHPQANQTVLDITAANKTGLFSRKVPYWIGISAGVVMAWGCIPMVFDFTTADWFNTHYVTTDLPPPEDLETWLEVGSWTWGWAEPFEGTLMFSFLCLEFSRNQMVNLGLKPYTAWLISGRANRLADMYPKYSRGILRKFAKSDTGLGEYRAHS